MTGRIEIIRKNGDVVRGREDKKESSFYKCWCEVQSLGTREKYNALQIGLENTIVFKVRNCKKIEEVRLQLKDFFAIYKGKKFKIYDATPLLTDNGYFLLNCRTVT